MTSEILDAISGEVYGVWFLIGAALVLDAGRICDGRDRIYQSKECRKHSDEKPDGLLYWYSCIYPSWFWTLTW